jgi:hypothetical protein
VALSCKKVASVGLLIGILIGRVEGFIDNMAEGYVY